MNNIEWIATTQKSQWQSKNQITVSAASNSKWDIEACLDQPLQTIEGFGACFNELGWTSLNTLASADKEAILRELFAPGVGANFNTCRMPVGADDFSLDPDQSVVIAMQNDLCQQLPVRVKVGDKVIASALEADSFNTFVVRR
jgi:O-glycosyl hydrolase